MNRTSFALARTVLLAVVCCVMLALPGKAWAGPYIVYDPATGQVLSQKDAGKPWYPASLTKLMTAYVTFHAIKEGGLKLSDKVVMSPRAAAEPPSKLGLLPGQSITLGLALKTLLVRSTNDLAVAIAERVGGDVERFVLLMNHTAKNLGMTATNFANPHGLPDPRQITSARDMAILGGRIVREFPQYNSYFNSRSVKVGRRTLSNRNNAFLNSWKAADGLKTGYVCNSGSNLVASATVNGKRLIAVVLGARNGGQRAATAKKILEAATGQAAPRVASAASAENDDYDEGYSAKTLAVFKGVPVESVRNHGFSAVSLPKDMAPVVCKHRASWRSIRPYRLKRKWTASFGTYERPGAAYKLLRTRLLNSLNVVHGGNHGLIRLRPKKAYIAALGNLSKDQATRLCSHFQAKSKACQVLEPTYMARLSDQDNAYHSRLEAKRKAAAKKRKLRRKKKRKSRKRKRRKKKRRAKAKR
ncbi:MAG: D-alanyl-D-alanine carboxypeptidase [Alphaproteobacteria bacterium]|nr:D-alanyl-D-alanine carboxypeptidase [Alphaproteobacteria bacterium]